MFGYLLSVKQFPNCLGMSVNLVENEFWVIANRQPDSLLTMTFNINSRDINFQVSAKPIKL